MALQSFENQQVRITPEGAIHPLIDFTPFFCHKIKWSYSLAYGFTSYTCPPEGVHV
jgi:hypothetical protein